MVISLYTFDGGGRYVFRACCFTSYCGNNLSCLLNYGTTTAKKRGSQCETDGYIDEKQIQMGLAQHYC